MCHHNWCHSSLTETLCPTGQFHSCMEETSGLSHDNIVVFCNWLLLAGYETGQTTIKCATPLVVPAQHQELQPHTLITIDGDLPEWREREPRPAVKNQPTTITRVPLGMKIHYKPWLFSFSPSNNKKMTARPRHKLTSCPPSTARGPSTVSLVLSKFKGRPIFLRYGIVWPSQTNKNTANSWNCDAIVCTSQQSCGPHCGNATYQVDYTTKVPLAL